MPTADLVELKVIVPGYYSATSVGAPDIYHTYFPHTHTE